MTEINGLKPNTEYTFRLRNASSNSYSKFSAPLAMTTLPSAPLPPTLISVFDTTALMKLYFGPGGGNKFILQRKLLKTLNKNRVAVTAASRVMKEGWVDCFEGKNQMVKVTNLLQNCIWQVSLRSEAKRNIIKKMFLVASLLLMAPS